MDTYPQSYHDAASYLVNFGGHGPDPAKCRRNLAAALRHIRATQGRERARHERKGLMFISGHFPARYHPR